MYIYVYMLIRLEQRGGAGAPADGLRPVWIVIVR